MHLKIDRSANMGYLYLREPGQRGSVAKTVQWEDVDVRAELTFDFDSDGHLVGIEIFSPLQLLLPSEIEATLPPGSD